jgi:hypothetical protein
MSLSTRLLRREFWCDPDVLRWPATKRYFYLGLCAAADDSGCLERDAFSWKCQLFSSPVDGEITVELLETWCEEIVQAGKLIPYTDGRKQCLFMRSFNRHQKPSHPIAPITPLPDWITATNVGLQREQWKYTLDEQTFEDYTTALRQPCASPEPEEPTGRVRSGRVGSGHDTKGRDTSGGGQGEGPLAALDLKDEERREIEDLAALLPPEVVDKIIKRATSDKLRPKTQSKPEWIKFNLTAEIESRTRGEAE